jgi:uncharacterized membrane protein
MFVLPDQTFWRQLRLSSKSALPLFDSVFAVALTLLAYALPDKLDGATVGMLIPPLLAFEFTGIAILLYWFKFRRLIVIARLLSFFQLLMIFVGLMAVVLMPRFADLVLNYGRGSGSLTNWTLSQSVNVNFMATLFLVDGLTLLFALSLVRHSFVSKSSIEEVAVSSRAQLFGFLGLIVIASMQLFLPWFNDEFVYVIPLILLLEEVLVARQFSRGMGARKRGLPGTATTNGQA